MTDQRSALFDAIRPYAPDRRFLASHVQVIDALADSFGLLRINGIADWLPHALTLIKQFEGCELSAYPDRGTGGDPWTIGWGATGAGIVKGVTWTQAQADRRLVEDVTRFAAGVDQALGGTAVTARQKGALVSFAYNLGLENLKSSTLLKLHKLGDYAGAAGQFARWDKAAGKVLPGLVKRRAAEAAMYRGDA
ncbi:lysozyme [Sphingomonas sp. MA1305]|uniref:lysozyme n=1 Tax=Sphingomonas sp. MA1305 TaxID=2479204 RepID=UPI0018DF3A54|nr:lysozyme [Sphingomonas sp. MA1305]MBI0474207.1 lysozyme [Sphingomonas sp. MA1305]